MTSLVALHDVTRRFRHRAETITAVDHASMELRAGAVVALVGPSGSGKTTLLHLIVGWDRPDEGTIDWLQTDRDDWRRVAVIPQDLGLLAELTLAENIILPLLVTGTMTQPPPELMDALGLTDLDDRLPEATSLGEQQRAAVARALVGRSQIIVADEPTSQQDEANARQIIALLRRSAERGAAVLVATHDERLLVSADRVVRIDDGVVVDDGRP